MFPIIFDFGIISIFGFEFHPVINSYGFMLDDGILFVLLFSQ